MWGAHWTIELEKQGVPAVYIVDKPFIEDVQITCDKEGMPLLRRVIVPHPCGDISDDHLPRIIAELMEALSAPLTEEEKKTGTVKSDNISRVTVTGTLDFVQDYFDQHLWTDGLPIVPPTEKKVKEMLEGTGRSPDEIVTTTLWPEEWTVTVEKVAINGVRS